ncbi:MAG: hypothetical protein ACLT8E_02220 [Akkermansia sp.]
MKFTISKQVFLDGLRQVASVVSSKTTPHSFNVKIEAENGQVRFTATDLDVCITGVVPANAARGHRDSSRQKAGEHHQRAS